MIALAAVLAAPVLGAAGLVTASRIIASAQYRHWHRTASPAPHRKR